MTNIIVTVGMGMEGRMCRHYGAWKIFPSYAVLLLFSWWVFGLVG